MKTVELNNTTGRGYSIFGVSRTNKGVLAMRGTTPDKLAARLAVFRRDGDTGVTLVDLQRVQHKTEAARQLAASSWFLDQCANNGLDRVEVLSFLQGVAGQAQTVPTMPVMPTMPAVQEQPVQEQPVTAVQEQPVQEQPVTAVPSIEELVAAAQSEAPADLLEQVLQQLEEPEQQLAEPEESVETSRKRRRR